MSLPSLGRRTWFSTHRCWTWSCVSKQNSKDALQPQVADTPSYSIKHESRCCCRRDFADITKVPGQLILQSEIIQVGQPTQISPLKQAISLASSRKLSQKVSKYEMNLLQCCYIKDWGGHVTRNVGVLQKLRAALADSQQGVGTTVGSKE